MILASQNQPTQNTASAVFGDGRIMYVIITA